MSICRSKQKEERQARTATDESMDTEASQERTRMVSGSVPEGGIRITASPGEDGSAVNDEITGPNESRSQSMHHGQHKERLMHRSSGCVATFALLGFAWNAGLSLFVQWQPAGKGQSRPTLQPVVHILIR